MGACHRPKARGDRCSSLAGGEQSRGGHTCLRATPQREPPATKLLILKDSAGRAALRPLQDARVPSAVSLVRSEVDGWPGPTGDARQERKARDEYAGGREPAGHRPHAGQDRHRTAGRTSVAPTPDGCEQEHLPGGRVAGYFTPIIDVEGELQPAGQSGTGLDQIFEIADDAVLPDPRMKVEVRVVRIAHHLATFVDTGGDARDVSRNEGEKS